MSERTVTDCDCCGAEAVAEPLRLFVETELHIDMASNVYYESRRLDLCPPCAGRVLCDLAGRLDQDARRELVRKYGMKA